MGVCRILSIKKIPNHKFLNHRNLFIDYINELKYGVKKQKGFLQTEHFWISDIQTNFPKETIFLSISNWKDIKYWNQWYECKEREKIIKRYNFYNKEEIDYKLSSRKENENFFLL